MIWINFFVYFICRSKCKPNAPVYQAIIADNSNFEQVLVSPTMINDHFPDNVLDALQKVSFACKNHRRKDVNLIFLFICSSVYIFVIFYVFISIF